MTTNELKERLLELRACPNVESYQEIADYLDELITLRERVEKDADSREWVNCPICGESDMRKERESDCEAGEGYIHCVNLACASNGGDNSSALMERLRQKQGEIIAASPSVLHEELLRVVRGYDSTISTYQSLTQQLKCDNDALRDAMKGDK